MNYRNNEEYSHPPIKRKKKDGSLDLRNDEPLTGDAHSTPTNFVTGKGNSTTSVIDPLRRSNRRQKVRGEKEYFVDSTMLLRDLKVKVREIS